MGWCVWCLCASLQWLTSQPHPLPLPLPLPPIWCVSDCSHAADRQRRDSGGRGSAKPLSSAKEGRQDGGEFYDTTRHCHVPLGAELTVGHHLLVSSFILSTLACCVALEIGGAPPSFVGPTPSAASLGCADLIGSPEVPRPSHRPCPLSLSHTHTHAHASLAMPLRFLFSPASCLAPWPAPYRCTTNFAACAPVSLSLCSYPVFPPPTPQSPPPPPQTHPAWVFLAGRHPACPGSAR